MHYYGHGSLIVRITYRSVDATCDGCVETIQIRCIELVESPKAPLEQILFKIHSLVAGKATAGRMLGTNHPQPSWGPHFNRLCTAGRQSRSMLLKRCHKFNLQQSSNMTESTIAPLHIPEIALSIFSYLDPPAILAIRLVSSSINSLILTHQKFLSKSVAARCFSQTIDWYPPDIDCLPDNFHLKTLTRLPKAFELARRANTNCECHIETACLTRRGRRRKRRICFKPSPSLPAFLARCARAILIIWVLNDIRQHCEPYQPLPTYIPPHPTSRGLLRLGRLFSRLKSFTSKPSSFVADANARSIWLYLNNLAPEPESEVQSCLSTFDATARPISSPFHEAIASTYSGFKDISSQICRGSFTITVVVSTPMK